MRLAISRWPEITDDMRQREMMRAPSKMRANHRRASRAPSKSRLREVGVVPSFASSRYCCGAASNLVREPAGRNGKSRLGSPSGACSFPDRRSSRRPRRRQRLQRGDDSRGHRSRRRSIRVLRPSLQAWQASSRSIRSRLRIWLFDSLPSRPPCLFEACEKTSRRPAKNGSVGSKAGCVACPRWLTRTATASIS